MRVHPLEVSRATIKVCLHNFVHDETVPECRICQVGRHPHEVDIDYRKACPTARRKSQRDHSSSSTKPAGQSVRRSPRDHPPPSAHGAKKKRLRRVPPEPTVVSNTPIKTMDGNPLDQSRDLSLDDQDTPRMDNNNPSKANDHEVESRMWVSAPLTKQKKEDISKHEKFYCGLPRETIEKTFEATTRPGRIVTGEMLWLRNALKAPNPALNVKQRNKLVAMDTICGPVGHPAMANGH
jgi:hypothetical protein